jgi:hypothetical protein
VIDIAITELAAAVIKCALASIRDGTERLDYVWTPDFEAWCGTAGLNPGLLRELLYDELGLSLSGVRGEWHD